MQVTRLDDHQENVIQALAATAKLGGYAIKKASTSDDLEKVSLTITFTAISAGFKQVTFDFEREDLTAHVNGRGEVERLEGLQVGDLAETGAEADAQIAAAAAAHAETDPDDVHGIVEDMHPGIGEEPAPEFKPVGEVAAITRRRRSQ